jgi:hypothetical protein
LGMSLINILTRSCLGFIAVNKRQCVFEKRLQTSPSMATRSEASINLTKLPNTSAHITARLRFLINASLQHINERLPSFVNGNSLHEAVPRPYLRRFSPESKSAHLRIVIADNTHPHKSVLINSQSGWRHS